MKKIIAMLLACVMVLGLFAACGGTTEPTEPQAGNETQAPDTTEVTDVTLKVWGPQEDQVDENSWLIQIEKAFAEAHPEYNITWENGVCSEGDAKYRRIRRPFLFQAFRPYN